MKSNHSFSVNFFIRRNREAFGRTPIYVKITVDGSRVFMPVKQTVEVAQWNQKAQKLKGNSPENILARDRMRQIVNDINLAYDELRFQKEVVTAEKIKIKVEGEDQGKSLRDLIKYHFDQPGKLLAAGTLKNYYSTERFLSEFLKRKKLSDIQLSKIDFKFITDFGVYLRTKSPDKGQRPCTNNTVMKHMERFQKLMGLALKFGWILRDPFIHFTRKLVTKDRNVLNDDELASIRQVDLPDPVQCVVRDMFVFSCYTGLAYSEISSLASHHITTDNEGGVWLVMQRKKTLNTNERSFHVLVLPIAMSLIQKYKLSPDAINRETIFPCPSNQYTNRSLKVIAEKAGLGRQITFHVARHTFATTVTLEKGISIESVSHMLGHSSIRTTQIYSKVKQKKVANEMKYLFMAQQVVIT
ncbi:site-specific integrase [Pedobacter sp. G11]|uniref:site-specific integrase n=1 Tax=Pedobacter sp. G11 TaxID=2482728 RepID=UPI000F5FD393|nr:site-specific integrase [Pedobacter sp. G11]AZI26617.1 site-specific integrase [Pedobacter sp. G11]